MAQATHSAIQWVMDNPEESKIWHETSDYIVMLNIEDEEKLKELISQAEIKKINFSTYREPDLGCQYTAVAFSPGKKTKSLCRGLKLALS